MKEEPMDQELIKEGLKIIEQASYILEEISDQPGITPYEFIAALDSNGITELDHRAALLQAATTIELSLESMSDKTHPTIH
jgi:hypothetical protein